MILEAEGTVRWRVICDLHLIILDNQRTLSDKISRLPRANFSRFFFEAVSLGTLRFCAQLDSATGTRGSSGGDISRQDRDFSAEIRLRSSVFAQFDAVELNLIGENATCMLAYFTGVGVLHPPSSRYQLGIVHMLKDVQGESPPFSLVLVTRMTRQGRGRCLTLRLIF